MLLFNSLGMISSMFVNCSVFCDVRHVQNSVLGQNVMFGSVQSSVFWCSFQQPFCISEGFMVISDKFIFNILQNFQWNWTSFAMKELEECPIIMPLFSSESQIPSSLGMNSSMFANCSFFCDVQHVQSSVLGQNVMFGSVRSSFLL